MHKDGDVGQVIVVVDDPGKIDHNLMSLVFWRMKRGSGIVGDVDSLVDVLKLCVHPFCILLLCFRNDEYGGVVMSCRQLRAGFEVRFWVPVCKVWIFLLVAFCATGR